MRNFDRFASNRKSKEMSLPAVESGAIDLRKRLSDLPIAVRKRWC